MPHVDLVLAQDWPEMASVRANQRTEPVGYNKCKAALFPFSRPSPIKGWRNNGQLRG